MAAKLLLIALAVTATTAAPQFSSEEDDLPPTPHEFGYGVSVPETGDAKEHKQTVSPSGRTEGEYRWLQPNGLYRVVRYYVEGKSGFQADVSEEPGPDVANYYSNSLTQENSQGSAFVGSQSFAKSLDSGRSSFGTAANVISAPRPVAPARPAPPPRPFLTSQPQPQVQQAFISQPVSFDNIIDGGIIDGGIIDGGIIDGGIIDGGIINESFEDDSRFSG